MVESAIPVVSKTATTASTGSFMLLGSATCFGLNIPYARLASALGISGPLVVVVRVLVMLVLLAGLALLTRHSLRVAPLQRRSLLGLGLVTAMLGLCYISSVSFIPVGIAVLIFYTFPMLILLATPFIDGKRLSALQIAACALAFCGIALAIGPGFEVLDWRGIVLAGMASCAAAVQFFLASRAPGGGGLTTIFWIHVIILPVVLAIAVIFGGSLPLQDLQSAFGPVFWTTVYYIVGVALQFRGLRTISAARAGLIYCIEPIIAVAFAAFLLGERLTLVQYIGGALVFVAVCASLLSDRDPKRVPA